MDELFFFWVTIFLAHALQNDRIEMPVQREARKTRMFKI